jgi:hypothetical protein
MKDQDIYCVIGCIDHTGAIHHKGIKLGERSMHGDHWPGVTHKRWRFSVRDWELDYSLRPGDKLTCTEAEDVIALIRKYYNPPAWVLEGEEWEALGRPRSGKAYEKHRRKWDKIKKHL